VLFSFPPTLLDIIWNRLHIIPIEWLIGEVDIFWSSDWTQPPLQHAKGVTTIHDVSFLRFPESFAPKILSVQNRRLRQVKKECSVIFCDSDATKQDIEKYQRMENSKLIVVYPGIQL
jgi:hypothetical protein